MRSAFSELAASTLLVVGALFPIVNPLGNAPIFLMLTRGVSHQGRAKLARTIAVNGLVLMVVSIFIGTYILGFFGISLPVVQVGGGLVVVATGWGLLRHSDDDDGAQDAKKPCNEMNYMRQAFYPLTLPLTVGPGSISVAITVGAQPDRGVRVAMVAYHRAADGGGCNSRFDLFELSFRRTDCRSARRRRDERCPPAVVFHPGVHWCADFMEWAECAAALGSGPVKRV
jgi:MarC family membrane protein